MAALSAVAALVPGAMLGVLGMGAVIAELALVLAAVGALAQIPGLNWLINEGGNLLQGIGTCLLYTSISFLTTALLIVSVITNLTVEYTSAKKSMWPGVSTMLTLQRCHWKEVTAV